jgi:hypothetical protein
MGQFVKESAHLKTDQKAFEEGWERVFGKKEEEACSVCKGDKKVFFPDGCGKHFKSCPECCTPSDEEKDSLLYAK